MTRSKLRAAIAAYLITLGFLHTTYAATLEWMRTLGTPQEDVSYGIAADGLGNFYISGSTTGNLGGPNLGKQDAFVSKYDEAGGLKWTTQVGSAFNDISFGVTSDRLGNVFIVGKSDERDAVTGYHGFVTSLDPAGNVRWTRNLSTTAFGYVEAHGVSADGLGNVYVTGSIDCYCPGGHGTKGYDIFLTKFDSGGNLQWTTQLGGIQHDEAFTVATDGLGTVYVGGLIIDGLTLRPATLAKYDYAGVLQWNQHVSKAPQGLSETTSVSPDRFGNVYVVGGVANSCYNSYCSKQFISKYDSTGSQLWIHQLEPLAQDVLSYSGYDSALEVATDRLGNAYVTGFVSILRPGQSAYYEAFISKYDALGNHLETTMLGNGSSENVGLGIVADGLGNIYITGQTKTILGNFLRGDVNAFIAKFRDEAVPEPAGIVPAVVGLLIVAMRRCRDSRRAVWR